MAAPTANTLFTGFEESEEKILKENGRGFELKCISLGQICRFGILLLLQVDNAPTIIRSEMPSAETQRYNTKDMMALIDPEYRLTSEGLEHNDRTLTKWRRKEIHNIRQHIEELHSRIKEFDRGCETFTLPDSLSIWLKHKTDNEVIFEDEFRILVAAYTEIRTKFLDLRCNFLERAPKFQSRQLSINRRKLNAIADILPAVRKQIRLSVKQATHFLVATVRSEINKYPRRVAEEGEVRADLSMLDSQFCAFKANPEDGELRDEIVIAVRNIIDRFAEPYSRWGAFDYVDVMRWNRESREKGVEGDNGWTNRRMQIKIWQKSLPIIMRDLEILLSKARSAGVLSTDKDAIDLLLVFDDFKRNKFKEAWDFGKDQGKAADLFQMPPETLWEALEVLTTG